MINLVCAILFSMLRYLVANALVLLYDSVQNMFPKQNSFEDKHLKYNWDWYWIKLVNHKLSAFRINN